RHVGKCDVMPPGSEMRRENPRTESRTRLGRVLVVEDDPVQSLALEAALLEAGAANVVLCASIAGTMAALEQEPADAIVLDVHLAARNDGWALAELADMHGTKRQLIVFSTGSPENIPPEIAEKGPIFEKHYDPA